MRNDIKFVISTGFWNSNLEPGSSVEVSNGFERKTGAIVGQVDQSSYRVNVEGVEITAHDPYLAWSDNGEEESPEQNENPAADNQD